MLLTKILNNLELIKKYKNKIRFLLLLIGTLFLKISLSQNKILTSQSLFDEIQPIKNFNKYFDFSTKPKNLQSNDTILIIVEEKDYLNFKKYKSIIEKKVLRAKKIKLISNLTNINNISLYFCILKIKFSNSTNVIIYPFMNLQPNSDLLFISQLFFKTKLNFRFDFFTKNISNVNILEIQLIKSNESLKLVYTFIKALDNLHSHSLGTYYYIPLGNKHLNLINLLPFFLINFIYNIFSGIENEFSIGLKYLIAIFYYHFPWVMIFYLKKDFVLNGFCLALFSVFNFKIGFVYGIILWIKNIFYFFTEKPDL